MTETFEGLVRDLRTSPVLFVGAGLSRRYRRLPNWRELLAMFAKHAGSPIEYYLSSANNDYPEAGTLLAEAFHEKWWKKKAFAASRMRYGSLAEGGRQLPLKIEIAGVPGMQLQATTAPSAALGDELTALKALSPQAIITTNYDDLLEELYPDYKVFVGQHSMLFGSVGAGEIYKIHGCAKQPGSLILTAQDYDRFERENYYLIARLATTLTDHPVVFLGYSMSDKYIQAILTRLLSCMSAAQAQVFGSRLAFVEYAPGSTPTVQRHEISLGSTGARLPCQRVQVDSFLSLFQSMRSLKHAVPVKVLRFLRESVYELVDGSGPAPHVHVIGLEDGADLSKAEVVVGIGVRAAIGYTGLTRDDLVKDVLSDHSSLKSELVVSTVLPKLQKTSKWLPIWRFLGATSAGRTQASFPGLDKKVRDAAFRTAREFSKGTVTASVKQAANNYASVKALFAQEEAGRALTLVVHRDVAKIDVIELRDALIATQANCFAHEAWKSVWMKALCLYDRLAFGPPLK